MRRNKDKTSVWDALPIILLIMIAAFIPVLIVLGPPLLDYLRTIEIEIPSVPINLTGFPGFPDFSAISANQTQPPAQALSPDALHYYALKNLSCQTLVKDFMIEAKDVSVGSVQGLTGAEETLATSMLNEYEIDQTTRTYVRGSMMKKVLITPSGNHTSIWKEGRIYQCNPDCTMRLLGDAGWQAYLDGLAKMRSGCAYFGRTELPPSINMSRLLKIDGLGRTEKNGFRCELFQISGDKAYAKSLLNSSLVLDEDERAILWLLSHQAAPIQECLDDGTGVLVFRNVTLDLTPSYRFDYAPGGFMRVGQQTDITYYTDSVPESFLALPKRSKKSLPKKLVPNMSLISSYLLKSSQVKPVPSVWYASSP